MGDLGGAAEVADALSRGHAGRLGGVTNILDRLLGLSGLPNPLINRLI